MLPPASMGWDWNVPLGRDSDCQGRTLKAGDLSGRVRGEVLKSAAPLPTVWPWALGSL